MQVIFGTLSLSGLDSFLFPQNALLLMAGFPDPQQASRAATNFIVNVKGLANGTAVAVTGVPTTVGSRNAIVMSDINAAGSLAQHAVELTSPAVATRRKSAPKKIAKAKKKS
jgi:hypothetical protein